MSLSLYFYKVKKGRKPNYKTKEWYSGRRVYFLFDYLQRKDCLVFDKNGVPMHVLDRNVLHEIHEIRHSLSSHYYLSYDDGCELDCLNWLCKRKFDFDKWDYYVLEC